VCKLFLSHNQNSYLVGLSSIIANVRLLKCNISVLLLLGHLDLPMQIGICGQIWLIDVHKWKFFPLVNFSLLHIYNVWLLYAESNTKSWTSDICYVTNILDCILYKLFVLDFRPNWNKFIIIVLSITCILTIVINPHYRLI